jgi:hypothetical protein
VEEKARHIVPENCYSPVRYRELGGRLYLGEGEDLLLFDIEGEEGRGSDYRIIPSRTHSDSEAQVASV